MSEADETDGMMIRRHEARRWLSIVVEDIDVARASVKLTPPRLGAAAYHLQQACEKVLKGLLVLAGQRMPKTHDLDELASLTTPHFPQWASLFDVMRSLTVWGTAYRYPSLGDDQEPEPSLTETETVARLVERLVAEILPLTGDG
ncbi:MAG: HEPN domain-containing protein [Alphaproteobacteria bacterium]